MTDDHAIRCQCPWYRDCTHDGDGCLEPADDRGSPLLCVGCQRCRHRFVGRLMDSLLDALRGERGDLR